MTADVTEQAVRTVIHVHCPRLPEDMYRQLLEQFADLSPVTQVLPPTAAVLSH
ncbi:hypothetical protein JHN63_12380 [Streptomyces sp. MBT65]|uniref:hypothetical protein n=1 Tax=Streptomyces sp. MBT65 TaxID=1488395 RepID=UPI00190C6BB2|nr:hypothetical protein [Streptomyces sp. MBT65]MBK3574597.1 hypothetical protein [Streptomyces sp. MBT65]